MKRAEGSIFTAFPRDTITRELCPLFWLLLASESSPGGEITLTCVCLTSANSGNYPVIFSPWKKKDESEKEAEALFFLSFLFPSFPCPARSHMCVRVCVSSCRSRRTGIPATQCLSCPLPPSAFPNGKRKMSQTAEPETCRLQARHEMKKVARV